MTKKYSIVVAGGGSTFTPGIIGMLLDNLDRFPIRSIKLYDNDADRQVLSVGARILLKKDTQKSTLSTTDPEEGFTDVDFVLAQQGW